jgi:hypothetical protein
LEAGLSEDQSEPVDLAYIGRALQRLTSDMAALRDEMRVQTAMILRQDGTLNAVLEQLRAMVAQHQRTAERVRQLEEGR